MAAPPAMKFATICLVTSAGYAETPRAATPWLPAKTATRARSSRGGWRACQRQSHCVNSSSRPSAPGGLVSVASRVAAALPASADAPGRSPMMARISLSAATGLVLKRMLPENLRRCPPNPSGSPVAKGRQLSYKLPPDARGKEHDGGPTAPGLVGRFPYRHRLSHPPADPAAGGAGQSGAGEPHLPAGGRGGGCHLGHDLRRGGRSRPHRHPGRG